MFVKGDRKENFIPEQFYLDRDIDIADADSIISVSAKARTTGVEPMSGEARISYRVTYKVIYKNGDGFGKKEESYDLTAEVKNAGITPKSFVYASAGVIATEYVGTKKLKVRLMLEVKGYVIVPSGFEIMEAVPELCCRAITENIEHIEAINGGEILLEGAERISDYVDEIFSAESDICIDTVSTATDICEIKGMCYTYITYTSGGTLCSKSLASPFEAEILAEGVTHGDKAYFAPTVVSTGVSVTSVDGGTELKTETVVYVKGYAVSSVPVDIVADAYSKSKEIKLGVMSAVTEDNECAVASHEKFSGTIPVDAGEAGLKSIVCIGAPWIGACNARNSDGLTVEGIVGAEIIYIDNDGEFGRTVAELPYRFGLGSEFGCQSSLTAQAVVSSLGARVRPGDIIEMSGELCVEVHGSSEKEITYVASYEELGEREIPDIAVSLYIVHDNETLFDVAKELVSDESELMTLNPDLVLPLKKGDKVLMYRPIA